MSDHEDDFTDFTGADNHKRDAIPLDVFGITEQPSINSVADINNQTREGRDLNPPPPKFSKGQAIHYQTADGPWIPAKIISVDLSIQPPSYGIELSDGKYRETEQHRLSVQPPPSIPLPTTFLAQEEDEGEEVTDDFGDFEAATVSENQNNQPTAPPSSYEAQSVIEEEQEDVQELHHHQPPPPPPPGESPKTKRMEIIEHQLRKLQVESNNSTSDSLIEEEEDNDDWGEFDQATSLQAPPPQPQPQPPPPLPPRNPNAVSEYGIAWSLILKSARQVLLSGHTALSTVNNDGLLHQLTQHPTGVEYIYGLCRVYFVAQIVQIAAMQLGLLDLVVELQENWRQCKMVMTSPLSPSSVAVSSSAVTIYYETLEQLMTTIVQGRQLLDRVDVIRERVGAMEGDEFPRVLEYSSDSKVCGLTLLPLSVFEDGNGGGVVMVEEFGWMNRRCLVPVANLWLHKVSTVPPELD